MGKLILCRGLYAKEPYYMDIGQVNIYSIEELCFCIVKNLEVLIEMEPTKSLIQWIRHQLGMEELAEKLCYLQDKNVSNKIRIQTILDSSNYYSNEQKRQIMLTIGELEKLPAIQRKVNKANKLLLAKSYKEAEKFYEDLIEGDKVSDLSTEGYAQVLHNLGMAKMYTVGIKEASGFFKQAYERNQEEESLKQYLFSLKLSGQEDVFEAQVEKYGLNNELVTNIDKELEGYFNDYESSKGRNKVLDLVELKESDRQLFFENANNISKKIEKQYRRSF